jgi:uncharacterized protein (DUF885 family)
VSVFQHNGTTIASHDDFIPANGNDLRTTIRSLSGAVLLVLATASSLVAQGVRPSGERPDSALAYLANEFVLTTLSFSPSVAVSVGLHEYKDPTTGAVTSLDTLLDALGPDDLARQHRYLSGVQQRLAAIPRSKLDPQSQADYDLIANNAAFGLFSLTDERFFERRPQSYAELLGNALFSPAALEYADKATRAAHLTARVRQVPRFLAVARANLKATNEVYTRVALEETDGLDGLITDVAAKLAKDTPSEQALSAATRPALDAIAEFKAFVKDTLPGRGKVDWRMGAARYATKRKYYLAVSTTPNQMLALAKDSIRAARREMLGLAQPLHDRWFPTHHHMGSADSVLNATVSETLAKIGEEHPHRDSLLQVAKRDVAVLEQTVRDKHIASIAHIPNLEVIPTPVYMRGIYGVAGAVFAPIMQPNLSTFYWVTPIPADWPNERAESKLREYNDYKMLDLTMHEGIPGHVVQGTYAGLVTPEWRRVLRGVFGNTPYVEGWAVYAEHVMIYDAGVNGGDAVKMRLTDLKGMLRVYTNAAIDILLHTRHLSGDSAIAMMMRDAFQERAEAEAKLQRAQLDYVQLETYFAGVTDWTAFRAEAMRREGAKFNLCRFHDTVLMYGALPVPEVRRLYFAGVRPTMPAQASQCPETRPLP